MSINNFASIQIGLASPERIREWSHGEVKKPETINYRSQKPERDGLFCERIFGPSKDWECYCGKYKKVRYKGVVCDRCGVEVTKSSVRRERMGHIDLAAPIAHIWYLRGIPSRMSLLLGISPKNLEEVVYFVSWVVINPGDTDLAYKQIISEKEYRDFTRQFGVGSFVAKTGAEAVKELLEQLDLKKEHRGVIEELKDAQGDKRKKLIKRLETIDAFLNSDNEPEWMVLTVLPVIPPDLRPMLQLDGGRFATSDLNDLYRRVITRNSRLKKLIEMGTPSIIVQNEKRMLQEAVDALIDNGRRSKPIAGAGQRPLKSLSHSLKGKQGRFRQNLLGKRVDFSGRSVIAVGPDLKMYECGIPREMAIQLFKPFVINEMVHRNLTSNPKSAEKLIERQDPRVWDVVEDVIENHPVLLNRAPTLHRLGIQAFMPKLVEGRAIRLHPLVTPAFNADFDGDQMAVHVPLSEESRAEAEVLMLGSNNILGPKDGKPIVTPSQDMVMGNFYLNMEESAEEFRRKADLLVALGDLEGAAMWNRFGDNEGHLYKDINEAIMAYEAKEIHLHTRIAVRASSLRKSGFSASQNRQFVVTTVGKLIFNEMFPSDFPYLNEVTKDNFVATPLRYFVPLGENTKKYIESLPLSIDFKKKDLGSIISEVFNRYGTEKTSVILDRIKDNGFKYSTVAGMTVALSDIIVSPNTAGFVEEGKIQEAHLMDLRQSGRLTPREWERHVTILWDRIKAKIGKDLEEHLPRKNPINMMKTSGARGNASHFTQLAGIRGLMGKPISSTKSHQAETSQNMEGKKREFRSLLKDHYLDFALEPAELMLIKEREDAIVAAEATKRLKTSELLEQFKTLDVYTQVKHLSAYAADQTVKVRKKILATVEKLQTTGELDQDTVLTMLKNDALRTDKAYSTTHETDAIKHAKLDYEHGFDKLTANFMGRNSTDELIEQLDKALWIKEQKEGIALRLEQKNPFILVKLDEKQLKQAEKKQNLVDLAKSLLTSVLTKEDLAQANLYENVKFLLVKNHAIVTNVLSDMEKSALKGADDATIDQIAYDVVADNRVAQSINTIRMLCEIPVVLLDHFTLESEFVKRNIAKKELEVLGKAKLAYDDLIKRLFDAKVELGAIRFDAIKNLNAILAEDLKKDAKRILEGADESIFAEIETLIDTQADDEAWQSLAKSLLSTHKSFIDRHYLAPQIPKKTVEFQKALNGLFKEVVKRGLTLANVHEAVKVSTYALTDADLKECFDAADTFYRKAVKIAEEYVNVPEAFFKFIQSKSTSDEKKEDKGIGSALTNLAKSEARYIPSVFEVPIYSSFRVGLNVSEFFISTHGVRKGLTDTALKTAESGYLTRRLVDVAQDVMIVEEDCGTDAGYVVQDIRDRKNNTVIEDFKDRLIGRTAKDDIIDPKTGEVLVEGDQYITEPMAVRIVEAGIKTTRIRNVFTCKSNDGICAKCYGRNLATGKPVEVGEAVGIMAAQSIGEPGTQLTMRTFHTGGVAAAEGGDITQGLPRVEELFEARRPKRPAVLSKISGVISAIESVNTDFFDRDDSDAKELLIRIDVTNTTTNEVVSHFASLTQHIRQDLKIGESVEAGDNLTDDHIDPKELLDVGGVEAVQFYILKEVKKVYQSQGIEISDKHLEVMIRQMLRKVIVTDGGDAHLSIGMSMSLYNMTRINRKVLLEGKAPAVFKPILLGISKASVETDSFLSAASFQETTKVLTDASIKGKIDHLRGLKENVIIGKRIPAGTGRKSANRETSLAINELAESMKQERYAKNAKREAELQGAELLRDQEKNDRSED
jgi:DNA-directed RNA polymerase beta' subunit